MSEPRPPLDRADDDGWLEGLLRADAHEHEADYLADDGFTAKVVAALPAPVTLPAWRRPALAGLWAIAGVGLVAFLPGAAADALRETLQAVSAHRFTLNEIVVTIAALSAATWIGGLYVLKQE